jgi:anthranilate synthase component 1
MQLLRHTDDAPRAYGGAIGWVAGDGRMDTAVVIRSALVRDGVARFARRRCGTRQRA